MESTNRPARVRISGATVVDADTNARLDVEVVEGRIVGLRPHCAAVDAAAAGTEVIDGRGLHLVPGFIDLHAHSAIRLFSEPHLEAKVSSGFTTELVCPDGLGPAPVRASAAASRQRYLAGLEPGTAPWDWESLADYLTSVASAGPSTNIVTCVPHSAVREVVMGTVARAATPAELREIQSLVAESIEAGGRAVSFGMIYAPGLYADGHELTAVAEVAAEYGVPLIPHIRNEASLVLESMHEFVSAAEKTGAALHVSHLKLIGNAHLVDQLLDLCTTSTHHIDLTFDQYPYGAGSTLLSALLPPYAFADGPDATLSRLHDRSERTRMACDIRDGMTGWENILGSVGPENVVIVQAAGDRGADIAKSIAEISDERSTSPADTVFDLLLDTDLDATMIDHYSTEQIVTSIFQHPLAMVGSDAVFGPHPHPRLYGTTGRILGRYAQREKLISLQDAVRRMTSRPADLLGLTDRGRIGEGLRADLVLLDLDEFVDEATYDDPSRHSPGVVRVMVGGETTWLRGAHTGARNGTVTTTRTNHHAAQAG